MIKKTVLITGAALTSLFVLIFTLLVAGLFYIESDHGTRELQRIVNQRIPGTLSWEALTFSPTRGILEIKGCSLSGPDKQPVAAVDRLFLSLELSALVHRELVIKKIAVDSPRITLEKNKDHVLNILGALTKGSTSETAPPPPPDKAPALPPVNIIARHIGITDGSVSFISIPDAVDVNIDNISLKSHGNLARKEAGAVLSLGNGNIRLPGVKTAIDSLTLEAAFAADALPTLHLRIDTPAGDLTLTGRVEDLFSTPRVDLTLTVDGDIAHALQTVETSADISGKLAARATVKGAVDNPDVSLFLDYPGGEVFHQKINQAHIDITMTDRKCRVEKLLLDHIDGRIEGHGMLDLSRAFPRGFLSTEQVLSALAWDMTLTGKNIAPGPLLATLDIQGVSGVFNADLDFSGGMSAPPEGTLSLTAANAGYGPYPPADADIQLALSHGTVTVQKCGITTAQGHLDLGGNVAILAPGTMVPLKNPTLNLNLSAGPVSLAALHPHVPVLADQGIKGNVSLTAALTGTMEKPLARVDIKAVAVEGAGESLEQIDLVARLSREKAVIEQLDVKLNDTATLRATGWADTRHQFEIDLTAEKIRLSDINHIGTQGPADGVFSCNITGNGTLENPQVQGNLALKQLSFQGKPVEDFTAGIEIADQYVTLDGRLNFDIHAGYDLVKKAFTGHVVFQKTPLDPWLQLAGQTDITGSITGDIRLEGTADHPENITVKGAVDTLSLLVRNQFTVTSHRLDARLDGNAFRVAPFTTALPGGGNMTLSASGTLDGDIRATANGRIPAAAATLFVDTLPDLEGEIILDADALIKKEIKDSRVDARLSFSDVGLTIPDTQSRLHGVTGTILANTTRVEIKEIKGFLDKGTFSITGRSTLSDFMPRDYNAKLTARALPITIPEGLNALFDVDLNLEGTPDESALTGTLMLDSGTLTREININKQILSAVTAPRKSRKGVTEPKDPNPYLENMTLDLFIQARNNFQVDTNLAVMEIHPDIRIQGSPAAPVVSGRSTIDSGTFSHYNKTFTLSRGTIDFVNPYRIEPIIDIQALHEIRDWDIFLTVTGPPDALIFSLTSDPALEQGDITSLLLRGKTTSELISAEGGTPFSPGNTLAQFAVGSVQDDLRAATGLDILEVGFDDTESKSGVGDINVTVGKKLSDRVTLKYDTASRDGQMVQTTSAEYQISDTVTASGFQDSKGKFGGELKYRLEFK